MTTTTRHTTAASLYAAILAAAAKAPGSTKSKTEVASYYERAERAAWFFSDGMTATQNEAMQAHVEAWHHTVSAEQEHAEGELTEADEATAAPRHVTFRHATGSIKLRNTRERLAEFAGELVRYYWALYGGGAKPTTTKKARATSWPALLVKVFAEQVETGAHAEALELAQAKLGCVAYDVGAGAYLAVAPQAVEELPSRLQSVYTCAKGWRVIDTVTGWGIGDKVGTGKHRSRSAAEKEAQHRWFSLSEATRQSLFTKTERCDTEAALTEWQADHDIDTPMTAADQVADVVAGAMAAAAIDAAQESAAAAELAEVAHTQADTAADVAADVAELAEVAEPVAAMAADVVAAMGGAPSTGTPGHASTGHATPSQRSSGAPGATGGAGGAGGQRVAGKSGRWAATFHTTPAGLPAMVYTGPDDVASAHEFETGAQRMAALQRMAREADTAPAKPAAQPQAQANHTGTAAHVAGVQQASTAGRAVFGWTVDQVQAWTPAELARQVDQLEDINHHTAAQALHCLRAGRVDLAIECERIDREHVAAGQLTAELAQARQAVAAELKTPTGPHTPHPTGTQAAEPAPVLATDGAGCTYPVETLGQDCTDPLKTLGALAITITRGEGPSDECGKPHTVASFAEADALLLAWADTVRPGGSCDKVDFSVTWPDGTGYAGTYELQHHATARPSLARHMVDLADFYTGKGCPAHMSEAAYLRHMEHVSADTRAAYEEAARQLNAAGIHTGKARPVSCDLRDLVAMGLPVAELVGLGVTYCGDAYSEPQTGAIVAAEAIEQNPRFYRVGLMGRDVRPDLAAVPQIRVTVRTECGAEHTAHHDDFGHGVGARYRLDQKRHGAPYLAQLAAAVAMRTAQATAAKELEAKAHAEELARLAVEFAHLERTDGHGGGVFAARNIRAELKRAFPGVKFSVKSDYSSVGIRWTDGPTDAQVCEVVGRFDIGASDSQTDYFYTVRTAFSELFGGVQYLNTYRDTSDAFTAEAIAEFWAAEFAEVANAPAMPTPADWRNNAGFFDWRADNWQARQFRDHLAAKAGPPPTPAKAPRKAKA
ncbi:MAG: LPD29 domain-containing protein [Burkholderiaceae bacterium]